MAISVTTQTTVASNIVADRDEIYPTATLFPSRTEASLAEVQNATLMRLSDDVPRISQDMNKMFEWTYGTKLYGDKAKNHKGMAGYRQDINKAYGKEKKYKPIYVDTTKPIGPQLKKLKS